MLLSPHAMTRAIALVAASLASILALVAAPCIGTVNADAAGDGQYVPVAPTSLLDTRAAGDMTGGATVPANGSVTVRVTGRGAIPGSGVSAVALSLNVMSPEKFGWLTLYPSDVPTTVSTITFAAGETTTGYDVTRITGTGDVTLKNNSAGAVHFTVSARGYYRDALGTQPGQEYHPLDSGYLYDTRFGIGTGSPTAPVPAGGTVTIDVAGQKGVPAADVTAAAVNIVAMHQTTFGWLSLYPSDEADPNVSSLNYRSGESDSNFQSARLSSTGRLKLTNHGTGAVDISLTVRGYFKGDAAGSSFQPVAPKVLVDSLDGTGIPDGATEAIAPGDSVTFDASTDSGLTPDRIAAVALNVDARRPAAAGWLSVYSTGVPDPGISSVTFDGAGESANGFDLAVPNASGLITITNHSSGTVHLQVSVRGYAVAPAVAQPDLAVPDDVAPILDRLKASEDYQITDADKAVLANHPEWEQRIPDLAATVLTGDDTPGDLDDTTRARGGCYRANRYITYRSSVFNSVLIKWHNVLNFCWDGKKVTRIKERYAYVTNNYGGYDDHGGRLTVNWQYGLRTATYQSAMQGTLTNCILKVGCYKTRNPYQRFTVHGSNGKYSIVQTK
ncbi:hypothetical protein ACWEN6_38685 [Sphaerisporangium sp. NPDC004334]